MTMEHKLKSMQGPILVLGASGFIGANLFRQLLKVRRDVYGVISRFPAWRLEDLPESNIISADLLLESNIKDIILKTRPQTVFDCAAYGAYSFQAETDLIYQTNFLRVSRTIETLMSYAPSCSYFYAGSSSEYGDDSAGPTEHTMLLPNSHYSVSKGAVSSLLWYLGKKKNFPCANLRLYSVYGPYEDSSRLIPSLVEKALQKKLPPLTHAAISRDFVFVDDVVEAFVDAATNLEEPLYGESFNVGTGRKTSINDLVDIVRSSFDISEKPEFGSYEKHKWDLEDWYANPEKIKKHLKWQAKTSLEQGLNKTADWLKSLKDIEQYKKSSKKFYGDQRYSVSAIVACYKDGQAIPVMYERLTNVFNKLNIDYEIIFVNDASPDDSESIIKAISSKDHHVSGITHSRNFGSQSAFRSGMALAKKNSVVLLDGDLQDPPELIEKFHQYWKQGFEVVYGRRVGREAPIYMQFAYKMFYVLFDKFSYIKIPRDAGDFSLIDKSVVHWLLRFPERDLFIRGIRAFAGFRQTGVDYVRPERMFGRSTNNFLKNIGWAKKGILSYSNTPLNVLSFCGVALFLFSVLLITIQIVSKLLFPELAPKGTTTILIAVAFFGAINLLGLSLIGEYLAKVFEEVKQRPHYIRKSIIKDGAVLDASSDL